MDAIYTSETCRFAYQLNWSVSVFWRSPPSSAEWLPELRDATEPDGVRVLNHRFSGAATSQFSVSTKPHVAPSAMVRSVKGRLQRLLRRERPKAFMRKHSFRSVGSVDRQTVEQYVAGQHGHHPMADPQVQAALGRFRMADTAVDLSAAREGAHCRYWYNVHLVLVNDGRWRETDAAMLGAVFSMIVRVARAKGHRLSRAALLADHRHMCIGCGASEAPADVAVAYMNNLAYAAGMRPIFRLSAYLGTFGEYDVWVPGLGRR